MSKGKQCIAKRYHGGSSGQTVQATAPNDNMIASCCTEIGISNAHSSTNSKQLRVRF
jgi:hypothetical protein